MAADNWPCNSRLVSALKAIEQSKEIIFFRKKYVGDLLSIATKNSCRCETFCGQLPKKILLPSVVKFAE